jgi:thiol:disulfide interchange protein
MRNLIVTFVALVVLATASWLLPSAGAPAWTSLLIAAAKALAIGWVFMELSEAHVVPRTIAVVAVLFIALLIGGTLVDVQLR